jgi:signal transduction histidine kinase/CheY-like chemotaxis protein
MSKERDLLERIRQLESANDQLKAEANEESHSRLMAEEALGITEDRLQLALDAAGLASWEWDIPAELIYTSARFGQMLEGATDAIDTQNLHWLPQDLLTLVVPEDAAALRRIIINALKQNNGVFEAEFRLQAPAGVLWIECTGKVIARSMLGRAERMIGINRNITRRKLADDAMRQAREEAVAANRAKDEFLAHISHEIRTPLNGVIGMNNLLAQTALGAEQRQYVDLVASSGRALLALVNDVLDFSRNAAGGIVLERVRFPLKRWLREAVVPMQVSAQAKGLELQIHAAPDLPKEMVGDPGRMRQIVSNLVSNAIKFTDSGAVTVNMSTSDQDLQITVQDTGIGIAPDKQQAIFEAFVQADSSTSRRYGGTGLGLAISSQLAHAMGGQITLESAAGRGSRFCVSIPLGDISVDQQDFLNTQLGGAAGETQPLDLHRIAPASQTHQSLPAQPTLYAGQHALVADDHEVNRLLAGKLLEQLGFKVTLVDDGHQAIDAVLTQNFDVVFMDIQMPQMNGWQATHELRQWEQQGQRARVPIIALTAHASAADRNEAFAIGMDGYLSKPLTPEALAAALRSTRGRQASAAQLPTTNPEAAQLVAPVASQPHQDALEAYAATSAAPSGPLRLDRLLARLGGDQAAMHEMARAMRRDLRERMGLAYAALQENNWPAMRAQAHALKGALASVTAEPAAACAKQLELSNSAEQARAAFAQLSAQAKLVFDALRDV